LALLALAWGAVLLVALPHGLGHLMLGSIWPQTYPLVLPTTLGIMATCVCIGATIGLHALGASRRSMRAVLLTTGLVVASAFAGAKVGGTIGTVSFAAAAGWLGGVPVMWWQLRQALHESRDVRVPVWLLPPSEGRHRSS